MIRNVKKTGLELDNTRWEREKRRARRGRNTRERAKTNLNGKGKCDPLFFLLNSQNKKSRREREKRGTRPNLNVVLLIYTGPFTVFVPVDQAFEILIQRFGGMEKASEEFNKNPDVLNSVSGCCCCCYFFSLLVSSSSFLSKNKSVYRLQESNYQSEKNT